jgi:uncharacterized protein
MKIAIIGTGISGLTTAHLLSKKYDITVFEANDYIGGHTATVDVQVPSGKYAIDTGFIVFNNWTYDNFIKLMTTLKVAWKDSSMSFSVKSQASGLEYNGTSLNSLFAQRSNFFRPSFYRMVKDIMRFNKESHQVLESPTNENLGAYLKKRNYSDEFKMNYIIPMGAAIWSASVEQMDLFPIEYFVRFFKNHGMLSVNERPVWKVIYNGSRSYLNPLIDSFRNQIHLNSEVIQVVRTENDVKMTVKQNNKLIDYSFDEVVFASHSDQTMKMLFDITPLEKEILNGFSYQPNSVVLHTDISVLPKRRLAWAAWNYFIPKSDQGKVAVTYNMNILQGINAPETFCVSLNMDDQIASNKVLRRFTYHHPVFTRTAFESQKRWSEISGKNRTHFCGAYWGYGFHEDGVKSALQVCKLFGERLP